MTILTQPLHKYQDGDRHIAAGIDNGNLVIASTRNDEHAAEGHYSQLITVISLQDAIKLAEAILAARQVDEDAALDAHLEKEWERRQDHMALMDDAIEHDYEWIRQGC